MSNSEDYDEKFGGGKGKLIFKLFVSNSENFWIKIV